MVVTVKMKNTTFWEDFQKRGDLCTFFTAAQKTTIKSFQLVSSSSRDSESAGLSLADVLHQEQTCSPDFFIYFF